MKNFNQKKLEEIFQVLRSPISKEKEAIINREVGKYMMRIAAGQRAELAKIANERF